MSEPTTGELERRIDSLGASVREGFARMEHRFDSLQFVPRETWTAEKTALQNDIADLKDKIRWLSRTVAGSLIAGTIAAIAARGGF